MEVHFSPEQEAQLSRVASHAGMDTELFVKDAALRCVEERSRFNDAVREGIGLSVAEALSAVVSKYLDCVVAAEPTEVETFLGNFVPRSRVREAINALLSARELSFINVGNHTLLQLTPAKTTPERALRQRSV